jgi:hypothetical protein
MLIMRIAKVSSCIGPLLIHHLRYIRLSLELLQHEEMSQTVDKKEASKMLLSLLSSTPTSSSPIQSHKMENDAHISNSTSAASLLQAITSPGESAPVAYDQQSMSASMVAQDGYSQSNEENDNSIVDSTPHDEQGRTFSYVSPFDMLATSGTRDAESTLPVCDEVNEAVIE